jgi:hypothetical protein
MLTRAQALQNRAFLKVLRKTGNVRLACREAGLKYATMQNRRAKHPGFAIRWDAALAFAWPRIRSGASSRIKSGTSAEGGFRTVGGEPVIVRLKNGRLQMRRAQPGKLTPEAEQAFLALSPRPATSGSRRRRSGRRLMPSTAAGRKAPPSLASSASRFSRAMRRWN